jgi:hypothetical protein
MPDIPIENFSTFFGNTSEDAEKHLFKFKSTCDVFNLTEDNVTCRLFLQTLRGDALEWYYSLLPWTITSWDVLETSFAEKFIPRMHSYALSNFFNVVSHPPSPIWTQDNEVNDLEENFNQNIGEFFESSYTAENENENSNLQEKYFSLSYTPYENSSCNKFEIEIEEPPPNAQVDFSQHTHMEDVVTDDEKSQEHWQQEQLVEEINLENNDEQDCHCIKEELFQDIVDESRILDVVNDKENCESVFNLETPHSTQDNKFLRNQELIILKHGFKALLAKQCHQIKI